MRTQVVSPVRMVATLGVLSIGAACGVSGDPGAGEAADTPVIAVRDWNGYPTSEISGRLRLVHGCLLVGDSVVFWAAGTSWDATTQSVVFESGAPRRGGGGVGRRGRPTTTGEPDGQGGPGGPGGDSVITCLNRTGSVDAVIATPTH